MDPTDFYSPVEMYTTVLSITIGIEHATHAKRLNSNKCHEKYYSTSPCHFISYYRSELIITIQSKSHFLKCTEKQLVNSAISQNENELIHSEQSQQVNNGCSYRTSAYFSWFRHHVIPLSLVDETCASINDDNDLNTRKWDMFIIWQGQLNTPHNDDQINFEQLDISFDHTNKSVSMASFHMNPNITTNTSQIDEGDTSVVAYEDNEDGDNTENDITQMNDKFSPVSTISNLLHIDDNKYYEDSAYQTLYADDNIDHIKWDTQSIIDSHETFGILSEVSSMQIKQIPIDHDSDNTDNSVSSFIQFNFINSSLTQLENKLSRISVELEEMEATEHFSDEYIKEIDNIFQLLLLIKKNTSQIDYIISSWNMDRCLSESDDYVTPSTITILYNEYTDLSQLTGKVEPTLEISPEENYQGHIATRLSTLKCLRVDLMKRCDRLVERLEKQTSYSAVNINEELDFISQNLVSLAHKLDDPDNNDSSNDTGPSTIANKLEKQITDLQEIQKEFAYIEENLQRLKCTPATDSLSCKSIAKLDCIESELNDMQINLRNQIIYLNNFHEQYSNLTTALQEEFSWMKQQESDLNLNIQSESNGPQANNNYDNNTGHLEQDITVLYNLIVKLSQYYHHKLLPMLENYDKLMSDGVRPPGIITSIYNAEDNVYLSVNILNLWDRITKELMTRKFHELITRSYEQITRNLTSTFHCLPTLQSFELLFPNGNLPNSNSLHCHVNIISDHINIIQGEIDWLHKYIEPIIMNEDRINLFTDTITNTTDTTNITNNENNIGISDQIVKFYEVNQHLTQLLSYFTQIYQQLSVFYIPTMDRYHQTIDHALTYINTIQNQVELLRELAISIKVSDKDDKEDRESANYDDEQNENVECALITYEKLENLCTGKQQCLELLENVQNNHRTIIDELVNMVKQIQISIDEVIKSTDNSQDYSKTMTSATTIPVNTITTSTYLSKLLDPIESTSQRFLYFISEIQKIISEYDQLIIHTSTRQKLVPQELSVSENARDTLDIHDSELFQDACIPSVNNYQHHFNVFDKQYEELLNESLTNSWSVVRDHSHLNDENQLVNGQTLLVNNLSQTMIHSCDSNERRNTEVVILNNILKKIDSLENNLKLSCCNIMNDDLVKNRMSQVSELRSDVTDKLNQTIKEIELVRMSSQQIEYAQAKLNALKSTFKQSSDLFQHSVISQNEAELVTNIFETCGHLIKKRLSETNQVIDKLQELTDETNSTNPGRYLLQNFNFDDENDIFPSEIAHIENNQLVDSINSEQNNISLTYFNIPLWYEQTKVNDEVINFLEHIKNQREELLFSYELSQRLGIWLSVIHPRMTKLKVKFQHLSVKSANLSGNNDLCSHLHDVTLYRLELFSQLPMFQCILNDFNEFKDVIFHLSEDYTSDNKIDRIEQTFFACFNKCKYETSLNGSVIHYTEQKIMTIINDFNNILTESSVYLSAIRNRLIETNQISTVLNELSNLLDEFSCLDERFVKDCLINEEELPVHCTENNLSLVKNVYLNNWTKVKILEMWHNELKSIQTLLKTISNDRCFDTVTANNNTTTTTTDKIKIEIDVKQLKLKIEQQSYHLTKKKTELINKINQENKLQSSITAYSVWLSQLNDKLIKLAKPNNLTLDTVNSTWKEFKDWNLKSLNENKLRINNLIKQLPNSIFNDIFKQDKTLFTNIEDYIFNNMNIFNELYHQNSLLSLRNNKKIKSHLELTILRILRQYIKFQLQSIESMKLWKVHLKFIKYFIINRKQLQLLFNEIHGSLSKLYRPSKLVGCCTEQLNSVKNAIHQLKTHERLAINLYNSLPLIKSLCHPIEVSQTVATINTMKHNFTSLMRRAIERRKILTQALKEDTKFDVAYYSLLNWFLTKLEILEAFETRTVYDENSQLSLKTLHREFYEQQSDYHLVMRMGSNLRERCTCTDPEKNILNEMLEKLQLVKGNYGKRLSKCQIQLSEMLITKRNPKSALSRLNEWIQMIEEHLGIENTLNTTTVSSSIKPSGNDQSETDNSNNLLSTNVTGLLDNLADPAQYTMTIFNPKEYENIASILAEDLREHEKLYQILVKNDHNNYDEFNKLTYRFIRLNQAFNLREKCLQIAADAALELNKNYSNLISWLLEVTNKLNNNEIELAYVSKNKETVLQKQTLFFHSADQYKIRLNMYAKIHHQQIHIYRPIFNHFEIVLKRVLAKPQVDKHEEQNVSVYCYSKCRRQFIIQYKQIVNLWHKLDQSLQCLRIQLLSQQQSEHALIHDLIEFECEEQWVDEQTLQLNELLTTDETIFQNLSKQIIPIDLIGSTVEQDTQVLANINCSNGSTSLVLDSDCDHVIHNTSSCELKECVSNSVNHGDHEDDDDHNVSDDHDCDIDVSFDEGICKDLEVRITFAKENFEAIKNREQKICDCMNAYRNLCEIITDNGNSSINSLPSIDVTAQYSPRKEMVNENYNNDYSYSPFTTVADQDNCDRANRLKTSYYNLLNRSSQRIKQLECYHKKLLEHNLLVHFNFDLWKQGYLQWIANRHYRLSDIFNPKALSALRTDRQLSNISTNTDEVNPDLFKRPTRLSNVSTISQSVYTSSNNIKPQLSNSRSSLIRSSIESLQPLSDNKHKRNVSHKPDEVNCSQFIQAVLHGRPTHDWANPIFIKSAFYTIDQAKKGIHKPLPTDKLIEHAIEQETSKCVCQPKFQPRKIGKDRYCFGSSSRVYLVRFLNSTTIVRVGGGWMSLNEFLDSRDPCRITHKTSHFGSTSIKANLMNTNSTSKRESNLGLINVTPINKSRLTTLNNMNSKEQRSFVSTPLTSKDCDMKSLNSSYENEASIHNNSSLLKQTVPTKTTIFNRATTTRTSTNKKINK
uniref:Dystonin n=1 Tax=Schistosoma haematobium TaxID=6185 RepID=A0A095AKZ1_SCHHA